MKKTALVPFAALALSFSLSLPQSAFAEDAAPQETRWTFQIQGNEAGGQTIRRLPDGSFETHYFFNDRGRGPDQTARYALSADGCFSRYNLSGVDYLKGPVSIHFEREGKKASWQSANESGKATVDGPAFYLPLEGPPEIFGILVRALLAAPGGKLRLLPVGEASIEKLGTLDLEHDGTTLTVRQVVITGLGFNPDRLWIDEKDGSLFATDDGWSTMVRAGWNASLPKISAAQQESIEAREREMASKLARHPEKGLAIVGARLFDSETGKVTPKTTVVVVGNRIAAVGPDGKVEIPAGAEVIEAKGKTLLPGLWDLHTHLDANAGIPNLASGITSVRDLANDIDMLAALDKRWQSGAALGPRVVKAGFMDGPGPYAGPTKILVSTEEEVNAAVDRYADLGYVQIKVYSSIKPELVPAIVARAKLRGLRVSGHIPAFMTAEQAVNAGFNEIQHINFIALNFLFDKVQDTRTPARFTAVAQHAIEIDPKSEPFQKFVRLLKEKNVAVDPTVGAFEDMFLSRPGKPSAAWDRAIDRLPANIRREIASGGGGLEPPAGMDGVYRESYQRLLQMIKALWDGGIAIEAGTDAAPGFALDRELELYVEAGIPAPAVLQIATRNAAQILGQGEELGSIKAGKLADLVLIDGDPTTKISDIRRAVLTVKGGTVYDTASLWRAVGVAPVK
ncbi:MAG TPA: amidohydrolase family protein [Thermoanaerobaculia bacterium]|nr:amidohydrolase family protein [Thermoanaerobaculia bacterium]